MARLLIPHTFPLASFEDEQVILPLKQTVITVDGYDVVICLSAADYDKYILWSFQIQSVYTPFLPFNVVCKLGRTFLGGKHLAYLEFAKDGKKVYCWTLRRKGRKTITASNDSEPETFEGFEFVRLNPESVDLH